jgi:molybdate transport system ATP-binding protein
VPDKGKIPPNTAVAWVIPQSGLSTHREKTEHGIPVSVEEINSIGQIAVIKLRTNPTGPVITWEASAAEVKRLQIELGREMYLELDPLQIHIMPLRIINDPRIFTD